MNFFTYMHNSYLNECEHIRFFSVRPKPRIIRKKLRIAANYATASQKPPVNLDESECELSSLHSEASPFL